MRNKNISNSDFIVLLWLIKKYYSNTEKSHILKIEVAKMLLECCINDNRTLKKSLNNLYKLGYTKTHITVFPKNSWLYIELNLNELTKKPFAQLDYHITDREIISGVGNAGVRLMYYYQSHINKKTNNNFCYVSLETIKNDIGMAKSTTIRINKLLEQVKFITKRKFETESYIQLSNEREEYRITKYNNHYLVNEDQMEKFIKKKGGKSKK